MRTNNEVLKGMSKEAQESYNKWDRETDVIALFVILGVLALGVLFLKLKAMGI